MKLEHFIEAMFRIEEQMRFVRAVFNCTIADIKFCDKVYDVDCFGKIVEVDDASRGIDTIDISGSGS